MTAAILGSGVVFLDGTVVNVALPKIGEELPASILGVLEGQLYVASGYLATLAALLILAGALSDHYGRRRVFTIGLVGFGATSILCGLAPTLELLVLARILQGAAGALLVPGSLAILSATFEGAERSRAFGVWASATSAVLVLGPIVGGVLVGALSWRVAFLLNVPLLVVAVWATRRHMPESRDPRAGGRFDWLGAGVGAVAVGGLAFGAIRGQQRDWQDAVAFATLGVGAVATVAFPILMARRPDPLVPLELFRSRRFSVINLSTFLVYGALYVTLAFQAVFFQGTLGYSPLASGMLSLPSGLLLTFLSTRIGALAGRVGPRMFLVVGPALMAVGAIWLARIPSSSAAWQADIARPASLVPPTDFLVDVLPYLAVFGIGLSLIVAPLTTALMSSMPVRRAGVGSAINNAISRVGQPLLGAVVFIAITAGFYASLGTLVPGLDTSSPDLRAHVAPLNRPAETVSPAIVEASRVASTEAFHLAMIVAATLLAGGALVNGLGLREAPQGETPGTAAG